MGGFFIYKRKFANNDVNISMHFQNPKTVYDAAKLRISRMPEMVRNSSRLNEIFVNGRLDTSKVSVSDLQKKNSLKYTASNSNCYVLRLQIPLEEGEDIEEYREDHTTHLLH